MFCARILGAFLGLWLATGAASAQSSDGLLIDTAGLAVRLGQGGLVVIDAETPADFTRAHIPGAVNLPYMELEDAEENAKTGRPIFPQLAANKLGGLGIGNDTEVVVYDSGNGRAASAVWYILTYLGHDKVRVLDGGFRKWIKEGRPLGQETTALPAVRYLVKTPRADWTLTTEQVRTGKAVVLDARSLAEFAGKDSGGARQAGHIPNAINLPWDRLAGPLATFKDDEAMRAALKKAGLTSDKEIVTYCNPGLGRSTFLLLALTKLGYGKVRVYPGSYIEWASDPSRPIVR